MIISIRELSFDTIIGLLDHERITPQKVLIDCDISYTYKEDIFIDYALVAELIQETMNQEKFILIETALLILIEKIKSSFPLCEKVSLCISKPDIMDNCIVSVNYEKSFL